MKDINHSQHVNKDLLGKAIAIYRHLNSIEFCDLDITERIIVYLFFRFLSFDDCKSPEYDMKGYLDDGLNFEVLTELAYRARWMEMVGEMDGEEVFSFILSLRDKLCTNRTSLEETSKSFCSSLGIELDGLEYFKIFSLIWKRKLSNYFSEDDLKLVEKVLEVSDGDFLLLESDILPGSFIGIGSERNIKAEISIRKDEDRVLGKMLLFMILPRDKWKSRRVVKQFSVENLRTESHDGPNKIVSFSTMNPISRGERDFATVFNNTLSVITPMIESGARTVFISSAFFLSSSLGNTRKCRTKLFDLDACLSILTFGRARNNIILLDKTRKDSDNVVMFDLSDIVAKGAFEKASCLISNSEVPEELKEYVLSVSRDEVEANDFMLYPSFYRERSNIKTKSLDEIDVKLREKYSKLKRLLSLMS